MARRQCENTRPRLLQPGAEPIEEPWEPRFERMEVWLMNTEYRLFGPQGPEVSPEATHRGRLDEAAKVLAVAPGYAAVRLFWADGVVSVEGPDLGEWMRWLGQRAPSEQQMVTFLWPNIMAACRGELWTRGIAQAKSAWWATGDGASIQTMIASSSGQPTPGVFVWKNRQEPGEDWPDASTWVGKEWPLRPTAENLAHFLSKVGSNPWSHVNLSQTTSGAVVGVLLDVDGASVRFGLGSPLSRRSALDECDPEACVAILGGPKGISESIKALVIDIFQEHSIPLVKVCLGPHEQMAHACVAYLRLQEDAGLLRATIMDLLRLGSLRYGELFDALDSALFSDPSGGSTREALQTFLALKSQLVADRFGAAHKRPQPVDTTRRVRLRPA
eukprot:CAMPEP_0172747510 /NCGR_PEP_ID=MMETSP1074-20121228/142929_1 /TAXON_ID=2916 /ORGANISM="Ceratium fusus, Strain PA161109" /LENGTH=386 /DNA_ID=CAMNT_0013579047 /DNA_START=50 /DNA_END=1207 /DNA_ORIENTATION=-